METNNENMSKRERQINIRVNDAEYEILKRGADVNCEGNVSMLMRQAALASVRADEELANNRNKYGTADEVVLR